MRKTNIFCMVFAVAVLTCFSVSAAENPGMAQKIEAFLNKEAKNLSTECPFLLHLYKDGIIAKNKAGLRIAETPKQFPGLKRLPGEELSGLMFYYNLYDLSQRVPHWHANATEMGVVMRGRMRVTIWDGPGNASEFIVPQFGTWMIPKASVHCLENVSDERLDFLVVYDSPYAEDRDFATAWSALPDTLLEKSLGLSAEDIATLKKSTINRLSSYVPGDRITNAFVPSPYGALFSDVLPIYDGPLGSIRRLDETNWKAMKFMAIQQTILKPGTIREPHWYTCGDVFLFINEGAAFFTVMDGEGQVYNLMLQAGDLVFLPIGAFHTYINVGNKDLEIYESFSTSAPLGEIGILDASLAFRPGSLAGATGLKRTTIEKLPQSKQHIYLRSL